MTIVISRLCHLCEGLLYRIALISHFLLNSMHRTFHTNLKQNYRYSYIIRSNNYKYYLSYAKGDIYLQKSNYSIQGTAIQRIRYWQCDNQPVWQPTPFSPTCHIETVTPIVLKLSHPHRIIYEQNLKCHTQWAYAPSMFPCPAVTEHEVSMLLYNLYPTSFSPCLVLTVTGCTYPGGDSPRQLVSLTMASTRLPAVQDDLLVPTQDREKTATANVRQMSTQVGATIA